MHPTAPLTELLNPRSVAVVGASDNPDKAGGRPVHFLMRFGFAGKIYPINPQRAEVQGLPSFASVTALPEAPDLAVIAVGDRDVPAAVAACAERGVKCAVVLSSGFGETGAEGRAVQDRMVAHARAHGMRLAGPNSQGLANFASGAVANFSTMFVEVPPQDGPVAIVSQSGSASVVPYARLREQGIGVRYVLATGNDADLTVAELACAVAADPAIRLVLLYFETVKDPAMLARAAAIARDRGVPMVALKAGASASGARVAQSHTGALLSEDRVVDAFFRRHGIWRAADIAAWSNAAALYLGRVDPGAGRLAILSNSGAICVLGADLAERLRLPLAELAPATSARLRDLLPGFANPHNPVDMTGALLGNSPVFARVLDAVAADPGADALLVSLPVAGAGYDLESFARDSARVARTSGRMVLVSATQDTVRAPFRAAGLPCFAQDVDAIAAVAQVTAHRDLLRRSPPPAPAPIEAAIPSGSGRFLSEAASLAVLAPSGLAIAAHRVCRSEEEAVTAFRALDAPVAIKACSDRLPHKSEHGLVHLDVRSEAAVRAAYAACADGMRHLGVAGEVIVARMVRGRRELALGAKVDPLFGPVVMIGDGGRYVEAMPDLATLLPPFTEGEVVEALRELRIAPLFAGVRGEPPLDAAAVAQAAVALARFVLAARDRVAAVDLNPLIVGAQGEGACAVDALVERRIE
jgi:acyl-CoA synthetase (NDP forming)